MPGGFRRGPHLLRGAAKMGSEVTAELRLVAEPPLVGYLSNALHAPGIAQLLFACLQPQFAYPLADGFAAAAEHLM